MDDVYALVAYTFAFSAFVAVVLGYAAFSEPPTPPVLEPIMVPAAAPQTPLLTKGERNAAGLKWQRERAQKWKDEQKEMFMEPEGCSAALARSWDVATSERDSLRDYIPPCSTQSAPPSRSALNYIRTPDYDHEYEDTVVEASKAEKALVPFDAEAEQKRLADFSTTFGQWRYQDAPYGWIDTPSGKRPATEAEVMSPYRLSLVAEGYYKKP